MIEVTDKAVEKIKEYLKAHTESGTLRIIYQEKGVKRPMFRLFYSEPGKNDEFITEKGITFAIDKSLLELAKPFKIDYAEISDGVEGFQILSRLPMVGWKTR
ncbi:MAG: hypothetical protein V1874_13595 [Spirochaetota bacterium]